MRIVRCYHDVETTCEMAANEFFIGRAHENSPLLLDLSPDKSVSRVHARIWKDDSGYWIEDGQSAHGTLLNNVQIKGIGKRSIQAGDLVVVGETTLLVKSLQSRDAPPQTNYLGEGANLLPEESPTQLPVKIAQDMDATMFDPAPARESGDAGNRRLKLICELPLRFAEKTRLEELLPAIVDHLAELVPNADSWALALRNPQTDELLLKAYRTKGAPHVSEMLARRAMAKRKAFMWNRVSGDLTQSILQSAITTGIYAPLLWQDEVFGVICVESSNSADTLGQEELRLIVFMAQYAAMALGSYRLQEKLRQESVLRSKLLRHFSPKIAERLLQHRGRLRLGGEQSEVTILHSDIRGFTQLTRNMEPDDIVEMLNEYFAAQVPIIFEYSGTIDKFMGDAILVVFGSPEPDPKQYEHALVAAVELQAAVTKINQRRRAAGLPCAEPGIGIHCGEVVHGFVGSSERIEYTVIGDVVNKASRYGSGAKKGEVLISPEVHQHIWRMVEIEPTTIETKHEGTFQAYRVIGLKSGNPSEETQVRREG
jgi:adenylate cyclase